MNHEAALLTDRIEAAFTAIARQRMAGIPVMNPALGVAMRGARKLGEDWIGVLVTPWFMNFMLLPCEQADQRIGTKRELALPSGRYQAIWNFEDDIGGYWSCSLFSPMFEFADMDAAIATADAALDEILASPDEETPQAEQRMEMVWAGATASPQAERSAQGPVLDPGAPPAMLSRRGLLRLPGESPVADEARP
ncbi:MAG: [NiFe]-hydrogenase assembly chaperone HybE [Erythrobacter sp.]|jgi:[NiFe] hydrogenase assembly HybE family chaperone